MFTALLALALVAQAPSQRNVYAGAYLADVSDFALKEGHFKADLRVWVKWRGGDDVPLLTFENAEITAQDELVREADGDWHGVQWRVQGTFRGDFPVHAFPFDRQRLPIVLGLDARDGVLVPDLGASSMSTSFSITGWAYEPYFQARVEELQLDSDLGSVAQEGRGARLRRVVFELELNRPVGPYMLKFALPLALILLVALLALFLPADRLDVRSSMGITGLLSCIAFHYTQADTLPDVTYLVVADKLFLGAYAFVTLTFLWSVVAFRYALNDAGRAERFDRTGQLGLPLATLILSVVVVAPVLGEGEWPVPRLPEVAPSSPLLRVAATNLDSVNVGQAPPRRASLVVAGSDGSRRAVLVEEAPAMTNDFVRLLPGGGMAVRWRLREGAKWSDGSALTAADVKASIELATEPLRQRVEQLDARTVQVTYAERRAEFLKGYSVYPARAASLPDAGQTANRLINEKQLPGAGPYVTGNFVQGESLELLRNERFAGPRPAFERVVLQKLDPLAAAKALMNGDIDVMPSLTPAAYEALRDTPGVRVLEQPGEQLWVLAPNLNSPPWNQLDARRALLRALNRDALVAALAPLPAHVASGWRDVEPLPVAPSDFELKGLTVKLHVAKRRDATTAAAQLAATVQQQLEGVGLTVIVEEHDRVGQLRDYEGLVLFARDTGSPSRLLNDAAQLRALYDRYASSLYDERRAGLELELQRAWFEQLPMLPLVLTSRLAAVRAELVGPDWGEADSLWWNLDQWRFATTAVQQAISE